MPKLSISEFSTYRWTLDKEVKELVDRRIEAIGIWRTKLSDLPLESACDLLYENQVSVSSLSWAGGFTGSFGLSFEEAIDDASHAVRVAARLGCQCLIVHPGSRNGHTFRHASRLLQQGLTRILPVAADYGVRIALEPMDPELYPNWTMAESIQETFDIVCNSCPDLGMVLDLFHAGHQTQWLQSIDQWVDRIALVQLADSQSTTVDGRDRCLLGTGNVPVAAWYDALESAGYKGFFEIELHGQNLSQKSYGHLLHNALITWDQLQNRSYSEAS